MEPKACCGGGSRPSLRSRPRINFRKNRRLFGNNRAKGRADFLRKSTIVIPTRNNRFHATMSIPNSQVAASVMKIMLNPNR